MPPVVSVEALDARESRVPDQLGAPGFRSAGVLDWLQCIRQSDEG